ncbi:Retrovirus-related Pol polyprotein from transposon TNT 1-94 [Lachnellula suecica]|uniref:Retrovirus-related Pol polyprotein from transposon TNT 1-94 n=1 Tax=Lachnellula suecica TaxID=602035 RepID=A0A8T9BR11_9HELO|nr:Retrovirus-related Pol polyprotein from transposon TNT 1-94 [Lachnellula suecica]
MSGKYDKLELSTNSEERTDLCTRPDIAFYIGRLSQNLQDLSERHASRIKELRRYIRSTIKQKIRYSPLKGHKISNRDLDPRSLLTLYSDSDWANIKGRKSISGHVAMLYGGPVAFGSRKQKSISISSTESEYIGMSSCCKQGQ